MKIRRSLFSIDPPPWLAGCVGPPVVEELLLVVGVDRPNKSLYFVANAISEQSANLKRPGAWRPRSGFSLVYIQLYLTCNIQTSSPMTVLSPPSPFPVGGLKDLTCRSPIYYPRSHKRYPVKTDIQGAVGG